jgi:hypothetical protein
MPQQIRRFGVVQTAKVVAVLYALMGLLFAPLVLLTTLFTPRESGLGPGFALALPVLYGLVGFVFTAIACAIYNLVAGWVGGIEVELDDSQLRV